MAKEKILILGAGLAGLSAAWHLERKGIDFVVFEKEPEPGGLCRSEKKGGFTFDCDGHLLHFRRKPVYNFVKGLLGGNLVAHSRKSYIHCLNTEIPYPFQANFLRLPLPAAQECLQGLKSAGNNGKNNYPHFKAWALGAFGRGIARHFMLPYNEKFWRVPLERLTCSWLDGFIPVLKLKDILGSSQNSSQALGYNSIFYYPLEGGISELPTTLADRIGRKIELNSKITSIDLRKKEITLNYKKKVGYTQLISTLPLPEFRTLIKGLPEEIKHYLCLLNYNSILVFNFGIKGHRHCDKHWIYFPEKKFSFFRIGFYSSFSKRAAPAGCSSLYAEVSYRNRIPDKDILKNKVVAGLIRQKFIKSPSDILQSSLVDIKYGYPIYDHNYNPALKKILGFLSAQKIYSIGRYGAWKYLSMEGALEEGKNAAARIAP